MKIPITGIVTDLPFGLSYLVGRDGVPHYEFSILRGTDTQPGGEMWIKISKKTPKHVKQRL